MVKGAKKNLPRASDAAHDYACLHILRSVTGSFENFGITSRGGFHCVNGDFGSYFSDFYSK